MGKIVTLRCVACPEFAALPHNLSLMLNRAENMERFPECSLLVSKLLLPKEFHSRDAEAALD